MKFNKKHIILIGLVIIIASALFLYNKKSKTTETDKASIIAPSKPVIKSDIEGKFKVENSLNEGDFNFPKTLPTITYINKLIDIEFATNLKNSLGINEDFLEFNDTFEGKKFIANSDTNYLVVTPKTNIIKYGLANADFDKILDKGYKDEDFVDIATNFLIDNSLFDKNQILYSTIKYLKRSDRSEGLEESKRDEAEIIAVSFNYLSNKYEIANDFSTKSPIYVEMTRDGRIFNSEIKLVNEIKVGITEYPVKNYQEFISTIDESKLISLGGDYFSVSDLKSIDDIKQMSLKSIKIAYYDNGKTDEYLQPVFVIEADVTIKDSASDTAILYLPAYK